MPTVAGVNGSDATGAFEIVIVSIALFPSLAGVIVAVPAPSPVWSPASATGTTDVVLVARVRPQLPSGLSSLHGESLYGNARHADSLRIHDDLKQAISPDPVPVSYLPGTGGRRSCPGRSVCHCHHHVGRRRSLFFFFQAEDGIRDLIVTGVQTCALPILTRAAMTCATTAKTGRSSHRRIGCTPSTRRSRGRASPPPPPRFPWCRRTP